MGKKKPQGEPIGATDRITLRVTPDVNQRADALVPALAREEAKRGVTGVTRAAVLKRALLRGLEALEREYR